MSRPGLFLGGLLLAPLANSHHSTLGLYDADNIVEIEGVVTSVLWRNPHPSYTVSVLDESGDITEGAIRFGAFLLDREYKKSIKVSDKEMHALNITRRRVCPSWNYQIKPRCASL